MQGLFNRCFADTCSGVSANPPAAYYECDALQWATPAAVNALIAACMRRCGGLVPATRQGEGALETALAVRQHALTERSERRPLRRLALKRLAMRAVVSHNSPSTWRMWNVSCTNVSSFFDIMPMRSSIGSSHVHGCLGACPKPATHRRRAALRRPTSVRHRRRAFHGQHRVAAAVVLVGGGADYKDSHAAPNEGASSFRLALGEFGD